MTCLDAHAIAGFLDGGLAADATAIEAHLDACDACRELVTELGRLEPADPATGGAGPWQLRSGGDLVRPGATVGRYVLGEPLGAGAMGVVYRATDPELGREVALKLVRVLGAAEDGERARRRLLREAQAMARLAHPNLVPVYEARAMGEDVFIAMERVEGDTLEGWLRLRRRSWREIVGVFVQAGRGLAAAHAAGVVHRDFKPGNVLVGDDGRVRVTDFGLAVLGRDEREATTAAPPRQPARPSSGSRTTGVAIAGTPAYMSPEVRAGEPADAASDQYCFAAALCEALTGSLPRDGEVPAPSRWLELRLPAGVLEGRRWRRPAARRSALQTATTPEAAHAGAGDPLSARPPTAATRTVPARIRRILSRAIALVPSRRYPSMDALVAALARARAPVTPIGLALTGSAVVALAALIGYRSGSAGPPEACPRPSADQVWNVAMRDAGQRAFAATALPFAARSWSRTAAHLDRVVDAWADGRVAACRATHIDRVQSAELLDRRVQCLDGALERVAITARALASADPELVRRAPGAAEALLDAVARCADGEALRVGPPPPVDPAERARLADLERQVAEIVVLNDRARHREVLDRAGPLLAAIGAAGDRRLEAEALLMRSAAEWRAGDFTAAEESVMQSLGAARRATARTLESRGLVFLIGLVGVELERYDEALLLARVAEASIADDPLRLALLYGNRGGIHQARGDLELARRDDERALELLRQSVGPDHARVAVAHGNLAFVLAEQGAYGPALSHADLALAIGERVNGRTYPDVGFALRARAEALRGLGRLPEAIRDLEECLAIRRATLGATHPEVGAALGALARAELDAGRPRTALHRFQAAREVLLTGLSADHPHLALVLAGEGRALLSLGRPREALAPLERALAIWRDKGVHETSDQADARLAMADVLWRTGGDRRRAVALAAQARDNPRAHAEIRARAIRWSEVHR